MLEDFQKNNNAVSIEEKGDIVVVSNAWEDNSLDLHVPIDNVNQLEDLVFYKEFAAIYFRSTRIFEFIFGMVQKDSELIGRSFKFTFKGNQYRAEYKKPSNVFETIAKSFVKKNNESISDHRNLKDFKWYYDHIASGKDKNIIDQLEPLNFFIQGDSLSSLTINELISLFKHFNFYMNYYDRGTPYIVIFDEDKTYTNDAHNNPKLVFPEEINACQIDVTLLDLFQTAKTSSSVRLKYLFYYQILEYCSYYYLKDDLRHKLKMIIKQPDLVSNSDKYVQKLIDELKDSIKNDRDELQMERLISSYCDYAKIKNELLANCDHFTKDLQFDGGFVLKKLFNNIEAINNPQPDIMKSIRERIDKLRNVMVHVRESRENKVILPTRHNSDLLTPYMYLIRRIAEVVAYSHE
ncbi:MAG: hypothetical protein J5708_01340 [Bacteroidales bacterium]|nr:hypothetical protein [Bacteroidales bacterium]